MDSVDWERIRRNIVYLRNNLKGDIITLHLYQEHVINDAEEESLCNIPDKNEKNVALLKLLRTKRNGYNALCNVLELVQPDVIIQIEAPPERSFVADTKYGRYPNNRSDVDDIPPPPYSSFAPPQTAEVQPPPYTDHYQTPLATDIQTTPYRDPVHRSSDVPWHENPGFASPGRGKSHVLSSSYAPTSETDAVLPSLHSQSTSNAQSFQNRSRRMDDVTPKQVSLEEIPVLVKELYTNDLTRQWKACKLLLYNSSNLDNKKAIEGAGGIKALLEIISVENNVDLLDCATGVLWNLSVHREFMHTIISNGLSDIVEHAITPFVTRTGNANILRNATGIIRNVSSASLNDEYGGYETRMILREYNGLISSMVEFLKISEENNDLETKGVENCVYVLRNLSFRIQEVCEKDFDKKISQESDESNDGFKGLLGRLFSKRVKQGKATEESPKKLDLTNRNCEILLQKTVISLYVKILSQCQNRHTVMAAMNAVINLTNCSWSYAAKCKEYFRTEKGLPTTVELLCHEDRRVAENNAHLLKNLTTDCKNAELIGKYGMRELVKPLPREDSSKVDKTVPNQTVYYVLLIFENIFQNASGVSLLEFLKTFTDAGGIDRLKAIKFAQDIYLENTKNVAQSLLYYLWKVDKLQYLYKSIGFTKSDVTAPITPGRPLQSPHLSMATGMTMEQGAYHGSTESMESHMKNQQMTPTSHTSGHSGQTEQGYGITSNIRTSGYSGQTEQEYGITSNIRTSGYSGQTGQGYGTTSNFDQEQQNREQTSRIVEAASQKHNPLQEVVREGTLYCKMDMTDGKKSCDRSWKPVWVELRGYCLYLYKDKKDSGLTQFTFEDQPVSIKSSLVYIAYDYTKKTNVFHLKTVSGSEYLFQADNQDTMMNWIDAIKEHRWSQ